MSEQIKNPVFTCPTHGSQPTYIICSCVLIMGEPISHLDPATRTEPGEIFCKRTNHEIHELRPVCRQCSIDMGLTSIGMKRRQ